MTAETAVPQAVAPSRAAQVLLQQHDPVLARAAVIVDDDTLGCDEKCYQLRDLCLQTDNWETVSLIVTAGFLTTRDTDKKIRLRAPESESDNMCFWRNILIRIISHAEPWNRSVSRDPQATSAYVLGLTLGLFRTGLVFDEQGIFILPFDPMFDLGLGDCIPQLIICSHKSWIHPELHGTDATRWETELSTALKRFIRPNESNLPKGTRGARLGIAMSIIREVDRYVTNESVPHDQFQADRFEGILYDQLCYAFIGQLPPITKGKMVSLLQDYMTNPLLKG